jgi:hypothetical protein
MLDLVLIGAVALLNLVPGVVALVPGRTAALYGFVVEGPALSLAIRHRAVLLALVGLLLGISLVDARWLPAALLVALVSKLSFLLLFALTGPHGPPMRRVALADVGALVLLGVAVALRGT